LGLMEDVRRGPVGIDSAIFIYYIEEHPQYFALVSTLFEALDQKRCKGVASALTIFETLVVPYRAGDAALADRYELLLSRSRGLDLVDLDRPLLRAAARLRAAYAVKTPDSIQLAAALSRACTTFLTHDRPLSKVQGIRILRIRQYLSAH
jgi:predicted nucleic acid-binding protein